MNIEFSSQERPTDNWFRIGKTNRSKLSFDIYIKDNPFNIDDFYI